MSFFRLKLILRGYMRHRLLFVLNLSSLVIGLVVCFLIGAFIAFELSFDREVPDYERIYRISIHGKISSLPIHYAVTMPPLTEKLKQTYPEVESTTALALVNSFNEVQVGDKHYSMKNLYQVTPGFFDVFGVKVLAGDDQNLLAEPGKIVLTQAAAEMLYGKDDPIGKSLKINNQTDYTIAAVIENPDENMHFTYDCLIRSEEVEVDNPAYWGNFSSYTYVKLREGTDPQKFEESIRMLAMDQMHMKPGDQGMEFNLALQPISDIHLRSKLEYDMAFTGNIHYIYLFVAIGVFILALACINFAMLITANASIRSREIGVSKVYGASRGALIKQFLQESLLLAVIASILSVIIISIIKPYFMELTGHEHMFDKALNWKMVSGSMLFVLVTGFFAGIYPALYLSSVETIPILKGFITGGKGSGRFRNLLTLFQFAISIALICGTLTIYNQLRYIRNSDLGFDKENKLYALIMGENVEERSERIKEEFSKIMGVNNVSISTGFPGAGACSGNGMTPEGEASDTIVLVKWFNTDPDFLYTYNIRMTQGDTIHVDQYPSNKYILVNETLARGFGWDDPLGKKIFDMSRANNDGTHLEYTVVGVFKDFHVRSFRESIEPMIIFMRGGPKPIINISIEGQNRKETVARLEEKWKELEPGLPFNYRFVDEHFTQLHEYELRLGKIFSWFSGLAIVIACLGLFGLASFTLKRRIKEIGIRKVLGSTNAELGFILARDFVKWVLLANIIALPVAWYAIRKWIVSFSFHASVSPWIFIFSGVIVIFIAVITVLYHTVKASRMNPAEALKYE